MCASFSSVFVSISLRRSCNTVTASALAAQNFPFRRQRLKSESLNNTRSAVLMLIAGRLAPALASQILKVLKIAASGFNCTADKKIILTSWLARRLLCCYFVFYRSWRLSFTRVFNCLLRLLHKKEKRRQVVKTDSLKKVTRKCLTFHRCLGEWLLQGSQMPWEHKFVLKEEAFSEFPKKSLICRLP